MLILASRSETRKSLLTGAGLSFAVRVAEIDERAVESAVEAEGADARRIATVLAEAKARTVSITEPDAIVIGADQVLAIGHDLLHKPGTIEEARLQLDRLRAKTHRLHAGVAIAKGGEILWSAVDSAELTLRDFTDAEVDQVLALEGEGALTSVGGYRLEGPSVRLFESIRGDYFTILGLPLLPLLAALREHAPDTFEAAQ